MIQKVRLLPHLTVAENVAIVPTITDERSEAVRRRVAKLLGLVGPPPDEFC